MNSDLLTALRADASVFAVELRPPRAELATREGMDAWIDTYHAVRRLTRQDTFVCLTDSAVGLEEEDNLRHLVTNLGRDVPRSRVVPFLTTKHSLEYCLSYAERAQQSGFTSLVILGGDRTVGPPRSVEHAWQLRRQLRQRDPGLVLGGWANPHGDPERQVEYMTPARFYADFYLTQIVSHHQIDPVSRFIETAERRGIALPGLFGVFYYRSANSKTFETLSRFLPVPVEGISREFAAGLTPDEICARTIRALTQAGARHFYISNLPAGRAHPVLTGILEKARSLGAAQP